MSNMSNREVSEDYERFRSRRQLAIVLAFCTAILLILGVVALLYVIHLMVAPLTLLIAAYIYLFSLAILPLIGVAYLVAIVAKKINRIDVIEISSIGTILRDRRGRLQIISSQEMQAYESAASTKLIPAYTRSEEPEENSLTDRLFPQTFPQTLPYGSDPLIGNTRETAMETPVEAAMETPVETPVEAENILLTLRLEEQRAKNELATAQDEITKTTILKLHAMGLSMRTISETVKLTGRKYKKFQELCKELGIAKG